LAGTVVLASAAGARRTATSLERFDAYSRSANVEIIVGEATPAQQREFRQSGVVADMVQLRQIVGQLSGLDFLPTAAALDARFGTDIDRPRVVDGRAPDPNAPTEVGIGETLARQLHTKVGSELVFETFTQQQIDRALAGGNPGAPQGLKIPLHVVGIIRRPLDLAGRGAAGGVLVFTPAFLERFGNEARSISGTILRVRTRHGAADVPEATATARRIFGKSDFFDAQNLGIETEGARAAIDVLTVALWLFAAIAGLAALAFIAVTVSRHIRSLEGDQTTLDALGMSRVSRLLGAAAPAVPIAVGSAVLAVAGAALASPLFPTGVARKAETSPGFRIDWAVLGLGFLATALAVTVVGMWAAWRTTRATGNVNARRSVVGRSAVALSRARLPPATAAGVDFALEPGRGTRAATVRSALAGAVLGIVGISAVVVFAASLNHLVATPRAYGWSWDVVYLPTPQNAPQQQQQQRGGEPCGQSASAVANDRAFEAAAAVCVINVDVERRPVTSWSFNPLRGTVDPTIVEGRAPRAPDEIALGAKTLDEINKRIGDHVLVRGPGATATYLIVGQVVLPSPASIDPQPLDDNATFTGAGLSRLLAIGEPPPDFHLVARLAPGLDVAAMPRDRNGLVQFPSGKGVLPSIPVEIDRLQQVDQLPTLLGAFLALLAAVALAHALATTLRRRRRELAVLRTLGFSRGQVRATLTSQATTFVIVGLLVGIPVGIVVGRLVWRVVAEGLGVSPDPRPSAAGLLIACAASLLVANALGAIAATRALRTKPAAALATE
jgi:hypothetical protein